MPNENTYHIQGQCSARIGEMSPILKMQENKLFWFQTKFFHIQWPNSSFWDKFHDISSHLGNFKNSGQYTKVEKVQT